ncbi:MAG: hypothetical protein E6Q26_02570 [Acinetobacter sp.]|nr:MAG: hypothetical protein E6Q26_02570 [Acinetobacter sp.]
MNEKLKNSANILDDEDAPELDDAFFARADLYDGDKLLKRGRPPIKNPKIAVKLRLDPDVLEKLRASGKGWQTRVNAVLREYVSNH